MTEWTIDTLKEYFTALRQDDTKAIQAALLASEKAIEKADIADQKHFEDINGRNQEIDRITSTYIPRNEYDVHNKAIDDRLDVSIKTADARYQEIIKKFSDVSLQIADNPDIRKLQAQAILTKGEGLGASASKANLYAAATLAALLAGTIATIAIILVTGK